MADLNAQRPIRWENGGKVLLGSDAVKNIVEGTLQFDVPGYEPAPNMDRGRLTEVIAGNERPCRVRLTLKYTGAIEANDVLPKLMGALVSNNVDNVTSEGEIFTFTLTVVIPKSKKAAGAGTATQYVFAKCYLPDGHQYRAASGTNFDTLELDLVSYDASPSITMVDASA